MASNAGAAASAAAAAAGRVKVYQLNEAGQWDDRGTGHVMCRTDGNYMILSVKSEDTGEHLLEHRVSASVDYTRQGETIITWMEPPSSASNMGIDLALSFQEVSRCTEIWEQMQQAQARVQDELGHEEGRPYGSDLEEADLDMGAGLPSALPMPELDNLDQIAAAVSTAAATGNKPQVAAAVCKEPFVPRLLELFHQAEESQQVEVCKTIFDIFRGLFLLNDVGVYERILPDEVILDVIAALEYDPDLPPGTSYTRHRDFLKNARFKTVVDVRDEDVLQKIHQNYRITYIKDVVLLRYLDDATLGTLTSMIFFNNVVIVSKLSDNPEFMKEFFLKLGHLAPRADLSPDAPAPPSASAGSEGKEAATGTAAASPGAGADAGTSDTGNGKGSESAGSSPGLGLLAAAYSDDASATSSSDGSLSNGNGSGSDSSGLAPMRDEEDDLSPGSGSLGQGQGQRGGGRTAALRRRKGGALAAAKAARDRVIAQIDALSDAEKYELRKDFFTFLQQLCTLTKNIHPPIREAFYRTLVDYKLMPALEQALLAAPPHQQGWAWLSWMDILNNILHHDPNIVRSYILSRAAADDQQTVPVEATLIGRLVAALVDERTSAGIQHQLAQVVRLLLDTDTMESDRDAFLDHIYGPPLGIVASTLLSATQQAQGAGAGSGSVPDVDAVQALYHAVELVSFCVQQHTWRMRQFILQHNILQRAVQLLQFGDMQLTCSVIRLVRACIGAKDDTYLRKIVQQKLLDPIVTAFLDNGARYNLLNSVVIEMVHFIKQENLKQLVDYLITHHEDRLLAVTYVPTFKQLKLRWEQNQEYAQSGGASTSSARSPSEPSRRRFGIWGGGKRMEDEEATSEYEYFASGDDDEDEEGPPPSLIVGGPASVIDVDMTPAAAAAAGGDGEQADAEAAPDQPARRRVSDEADDDIFPGATDSGQKLIAERKDIKEIGAKAVASGLAVTGKDDEEERRFLEMTAKLRQKRKAEEEEGQFDLVARVNQRKRAAVVSPTGSPSALSPLGSPASPAMASPTGSPSALSPSSSPSASASALNGRPGAGKFVGTPFGKGAAGKPMTLGISLRTGLAARAGAASSPDSSSSSSPPDAARSPPRSRSASPPPVGMPAFDYRSGIRKPSPGPKSPPLSPLTSPRTAAAGASPPPRSPPSPPSTPSTPNLSSLSLSSPLTPGLTAAPSPSPSPSMASPLSRPLDIPPGSPKRPREEWGAGTSAGVALPADREAAAAAGMDWQPDKKRRRLESGEPQSSPAR